MQRSSMSNASIALVLSAALMLMAGCGSESKYNKVGDCSALPGQTLPAFDTSDVQARFDELKPKCVADTDNFTVQSVPCQFNSSTLDLTDKRVVLLVTDEKRGITYFGLGGQRWRQDPRRVTDSDFGEDSNSDHGDALLAAAGCV